MRFPWDSKAFVTTEYELYLITGLNELSLTINYLDITDPVETLM
jgi:hypothetical protein